VQLLHLLHPSTLRVFLLLLLHSSSQKEKGGDGGDDARAREPPDSIFDFPVQDQVERLTDEVHAIVGEAAKYPHYMDRSATAAHIDTLLRAGVSPSTIRDSIRVPAQRAAAPIGTFYYFARSDPPGPIMRAHAQILRAQAEPQFPLIHIVSRGNPDAKSHRRQSTIDTVNQLAEKLAARGC
jgi:hypothetical protein